jgi:inosine-uridine nucleoside N-ribohydrolase
VLHFAGVRGVDVVQGQAKPLMRPAPMLCPEIHGETGLDGCAGRCFVGALGRQGPLPASHM